jgi:hypothetical protein
MKNFKYKYLKYKNKYLELKNLIGGKPTLSSPISDINIDSLNISRERRTSLTHSISSNNNEFTSSNINDVCINIKLNLSSDEINKEKTNKESELQKFIFIVNKKESDLVNFINFIGLLFTSFKNDKIENKKYITSHIFKYIDFFIGLKILQDIIKIDNINELYKNTYNKFIEKINKMYDERIKNKSIFNFMNNITNKDEIKERDEFINKSFDKIYKYIIKEFCNQTD